jgi:hypothetical protein
MGIDTSTLSLIERNKRRLSVVDMTSFAGIIKQSPRRVLKACLEEALPGFAKNSGGKLVGEILESIAQEEEANT